MFSDGRDSDMRSAFDTEFIMAPSIAPSTGSSGAFLI